MDIYNQLNTQEKCIEFLENKRWLNGVICPYCQSKTTHKHLKRHQCNACHRSFSVTVGTLFHHTHIPLQQWFLLIRLMLNAKKGLSSLQASRDLQMRPATVWSMMHRIRNAFNQHNTDLFAGIVEMDETYIKTDNKDDDDKPNKRGRGAKKSTVVGIRHKNGSVKAKVINNVNANTLTEYAIDNIEVCSEVQTDEFRSYAGFNKMYSHQTVNHQREYVTANGITTNGLEGFWSLLKRGIQGNFHHISKHYLQKYVDEFCFRYNNRDNKMSFSDVLDKMLFI